MLYSVEIKAMGRDRLLWAWAEILNMHINFRRKKKNHHCHGKRQRGQLDAVEYFVHECN